MLLTGAPDPWAARLADMAARALSSLGEHVLTRDLEIALGDLHHALAERGFVAEAEQVATAERRLAATLGVLNSRSTRVPPPA